MVETHEASRFTNVAGVRVLLFPLLWLLVACSETSPDIAKVADASPSVDGKTPLVPDAASRDAEQKGQHDTGPRLVESGAPEAGTPRAVYHGRVQALNQVTSGTSGAAGFVFSLDAAFAKSSDYGSPFDPPCNPAPNPCCYVSPQASGTYVITAPVSAGNVAVKNNGSTLGTLTPFSPSVPVYDAIGNPPTSGITWQPGDALTIIATGDTVHAFSGSVVTCARISGVTPGLSTVLPITLSADLKVSWAPDAARTDQIVLARAFAGTPTTPEGYVACVVSDAVGSVTFPVALFVHFHGGDQGSLDLLRYSTTTITTDNAAIDLLQGSYINALATYR